MLMKSGSQGFTPRLTRTPDEGDPAPGDLQRLRTEERMFSQPGGAGPFSGAASFSPPDMPLARWQWWPSCQLGESMPLSPQLRACPTGTPGRQAERGAEGAAAAPRPGPASLPR